MNKLFIRDDVSRSLIILFLGWGFPPEIFSGLRKHGFDILVMTGYDGMCGTTIEQEIRASIQADSDMEITGYDEVVVIGWSFGVKMASLFLSQTNIPVTMRLAVNGTEYHIDDSKGIPEQVFNGTLSGLSEKTLEKFRIRSAGSREKFKLLAENCDMEALTSDIEVLREELEWFQTLPKVPASTRQSLWDKVIVGEEDRIFPPGNQLSAWNGYDIFSVKGMGHVPDFQWIIDNFVVDKRKVCDKFATAGLTYADNAVAQHITARKLYEKFHEVLSASELVAGKSFQTGQLSVLELGYGDGTFTRMYAPELIRHCRNLILNDIHQNGRTISHLTEYKESLDPDSRCRLDMYSIDAESLTFARNCLKGESHDLIFSSSMFQWLNSPATMLRRCANALRNNGIIAISFYGPGTFKEIHETVGTGLKYPSPEWMEKVAKESGMNVESLDRGVETMTFDSPSDALRHLKLTGVNALPGRPSPARVRRLLNHWPLDKDGKAPLTFRPIYMILSKNKPR